MKKQNKLTPTIYLVFLIILDIINFMLQLIEGDTSAMIFWFIKGSIVGFGLVCFYEYEFNNGSEKYYNAGWIAFILGALMALFSLICFATGNSIY
jgi:hypothetical protein